MTALVVYLQNTLAQLREKQEGQTMAEYALILGGIAVVVIAGILILGPAISDLFKSTGSSSRRSRARRFAWRRGGGPAGFGRWPAAAPRLRGRNGFGLERSEGHADDEPCGTTTIRRLRHHVARPQEGERR